MENNQLLPFERNRYYVGKLLTSADFQAEQTYHNHKRRFLNEMMFGSGNDVVVCRDRLSASGTLYTLLAVHDRECARKMLTVMENGRRTGEASCLLRFSQNETMLFLFPYYAVCQGQGNRRPWHFYGEKYDG